MTALPLVLVTGEPTSISTSVKVEGTTTDNGLSYRKLRFFDTPHFRQQRVTDRDRLHIPYQFLLEKEARQPAIECGGAIIWLRDYVAHANRLLRKIPS